MQIDEHISDYHLKNTIKNDLQVIQKRSRSIVPALLAIFFMSLAYLGARLSMTAQNIELNNVFVIALAVAAGIMVLLAILVILSSYVLLQAYEFRKESMAYLSFFGYKKYVSRNSVVSIEVMKEMMYENGKLSDVLMHVQLLRNGRTKEFPFASISKKERISDIISSPDDEHIKDIENDANKLAKIVAGHWNLQVTQKTLINKIE